jgi:hypothetical protein
MSRRKYIRFRPYFIDVLWKNCGKEAPALVENIVEKQGSVLVG